MDQAVEPVRAAVLLARLGDHRRVAGNEAGGLAAYQEAGRLVAATPPSAERARVFAAHAYALTQSHRAREGFPRCEEAIATAQAVKARTEEAKALRVLATCLVEFEAAIATRVAAYPRAQLLAALPGVGTINPAQLLAEVGPILDRVSTAEQAAAECGAAPVTRASGKTTGVYFRWGRQPAGPQGPDRPAHNARLQSPWASRLYADARTCGKRNPHATRIVARAWLRVIWACWHTGTPYDPYAHLAEQRLAAP